MADEAPETLVFFGPQHPGAPGNIAFKLWLRGDVVVKAEVVPGFLHRGFEKMMENRTWEMNTVMSYRFCVEDPDHLEIAYAMAVEDLVKITPPDNAVWFRMIQAEMSRVASHLFWTHFIGGSVGLRTPAYWATTGREEILKWFAKISGHRVYHSISVPGGVRVSLPETFVEDTLKVVEYVADVAKRVEKSILRNSVFKARTVGLGVLNSKTALELGVTGPVLRATGLSHDLRKVSPYLYYDKVSFEIPVGSRGDAYDRSVVRFREIHESLKIIRQAVEKIEPDKPMRAKAPLTAPPGEGWARVESARGEYMIHVFSTGGRKPYRVRLRSMSMPLLTTVIDHLVKTEEITIADFPVLLASLDPCPPDLDR